MNITETSKGMIRTSLVEHYKESMRMKLNQHAVEYYEAYVEFMRETEGQAEVDYLIAHCDSFLAQEIDNYRCMARAINKHPIV